MSKVVYNEEKKELILQIRKEWIDFNQRLEELISKDETSRLGEKGADKKPKINIIATNILRILKEFRKRVTKSIEKIEKNLLDEIFQELIKLKDVIYEERDKDREYVEMTLDQIGDTARDVLKTYRDIWKQGKKLRIIPG